MSIIRRVAALSLAGLVLLGVGCSNDVKVGAIISETGAVATYGASVKKGIDLALEEINAAGGYEGGTYTVVYRDDATMPERGVQAATELIDTEDIKYIIGAISSPVTLAIAPICEKNNVLLLSPSSSAPEISEAGGYIFRNYPSDILEGTSMARFAKGQGFERVVIFAIDNAWGAGLTDVFTKEYESKFRSVVKVFNFEDSKERDFSEQIAQLEELNPDGIYIVSYDAGLAALLTELDGVSDAVLMGTSSVPENIPQIVGEAANKLIFPRPDFDVESTEPATASFVQAYREKYGVDPDTYSAHGYDALKLIHEAIVTAESTHPMNVMIGLTSIKEHKGAAGLTGFDKNGDVVRYPRLFVVHEGKMMPWERFSEEGLTLARSGG